jgi:hypothetical protein
VKDALGNILLVAGSITICYAVAEFAFFRFMLPYMSLNILPHLPDRAAYFMQSSKSHFVPRDYIVLVGDSYAQGMGDWLYANGGDQSKPHHSANVLHDQLGTDVVSVGRAAAGSAEAMVLRMTRVYDDSYCYLFPHIAEPKHMLIYFSEGSDLDENYMLLDHQVRPDGGDLRAQIDRFLDEHYAARNGWRCHGHFGDMLFRMARFLVKYRNFESELPDRPVTQEVIIGNRPHGVWQLNIPSLALDEKQTGASVIVYERSLMWLRQRFRNVPMTVVYIPAPASMYRHATDQVISYEIYLPITDPSQVGKVLKSYGRVFSTSAIYKKSQKICEMIRGITLAQGIDFIDTRPTFRAAAAQRPLHGPKDWLHLNENGYRVLGSYLAKRLGAPAADACDDRWDATDAVMSLQSPAVAIQERIESSGHRSASALGHKQTFARQ